MGKIFQNNVSRKVTHLHSYTCPYCFKGVYGGETPSHIVKCGLNFKSVTPGQNYTDLILHFLGFKKFDRNCLDNDDFSESVQSLYKYFYDLRNFHVAKKAIRILKCNRLLKLILYHYSEEFRTHALPLYEDILETMSPKYQNYSFIFREFNYFINEYYKKHTYDNEMFSLNIPMHLAPFPVSYQDGDFDN